MQNLSLVNWFLVTIWVFMTALLCWDVRPVQDIALAFVALGCGALFEWWGTNTRLWHSFSGERRPPWILPAWPVADLATARIAFALERIFMKKTKAWSLAYWVFARILTALDLGLAGLDLDWTVRAREATER